MKLNDKVRVHVTPEGLSHLRRCQKMYLLADRRVATLELPLWEVMTIFASQLYPHCPHPPFTNMEIDLLE